MGTEQVKPRHEGLGAMLAACLVVLGLCVIVGVIIWMIMSNRGVAHSPGHGSRLLSPGAVAVALAGPRAEHCNGMPATDI